MGFWCSLAKHYHSVASNLMRVGNAFCSHSTHELYWKYLFLLSHVKAWHLYSIALYWLSFELEDFKSSVIVFEWYTAGYDAFYSPLNKLVFYATETLITCTFYIVSLVYIYTYIYVCVCVINIYLNIHDCVSNAYIDETYDCVSNAYIDETYDCVSNACIDETYMLT